MALNKFVSGVDTSFTSKLNNTYAVTLRQGVRNLIRQLQDRSVDFSADGGEWAEAYVVASGQNDSVDLNNTTTTFFQDKYIPLLSSGTISSETTISSYWQNADHAFDNNEATYASATGSNGYVGKTFSAKYINYIYIHFTSALQSASNTHYIETYDGSSWNIIKTYNTSSTTTTIYDFVQIDDTVSGIRLRNQYYSNPSQKTYLYELKDVEVDSSSTNIIVQNIPSGTFSSNISSCFGTALVSDLEEGAEIQYKLTNATEDTGWLEVNNVSTFTPFTSEPTTCIVKLIPKSTSPTPGYPSIKGFGVVE